MNENKYMELFKNKTRRFFMTIHILICSAAGMIVGLILFLISTIFTSLSLSPAEFCSVSAGYFLVFPGVFGGIIHLLRQNDNH